MDVDFDFCDPNEADFWAVKLSLAHYIETNEYDSGSVADTICEQHGIGSVVKANSQVVGYISALNLHAEGIPGLDSIKKYMRKKARKVSPSEPELQDLMDDPSRPLGLLLNYRLPNAPDQLAPPLHKTIFDELAEVAAEEPEFGFENIVLMTRSYVKRADAATLDPDVPRAKRRKRLEDMFVPFYPEEDAYFKHATTRYDFRVLDDSVEGKLTLDAVIDVYGHILIIPATAIPTIVSDMETLIAQALESQVETW